ncbi:MAG: N-acetylmuramoyl-L-alanine amidase LytC [Firmicutes bacterium]|nr:N-acetylmuramoyl-L-alanine amidase LytC [Bacillota bacterium]
MKRLIALLAVLMIATLVSSAWAATPGVVSTAMLNLRSGPGQAFQVVATLPLATPLVVLAESGDWKQVMTTTGRTGWVFGQFVADEPSFVAEPRNVSVRVASLNVRQGPATSYPVLGTVREGQLLAVTGHMGSWLQVRTAGGLGFVHADFVAPVVEPDQDVSVPLARVNVSLLNLRSGAGTQFPVIARLTRGTPVAVLSEDTWARVLLENGAIGFVAREFLSPVDGQALARISAESVNQRSGPGTTFPVLTAHPRGQTVAITGLSGDWVQVNGRAGSGFILGSLLSFSFATGEEDALPPTPNLGAGLSGFTVVIDPGHGGRDPGAIAASGLRESDVNLTMSHKLRAKLEAAGATVVMTRTTDVGLTLAERVAIANGSGADLLVSIHNNAHTNPQISGTQTFHGVTDGSFSLGLGVHRRLVALGLNDRGVLTANFAVLQRTTVPAILTETAFLSNPQNAGLLAQESFLDQAVAAHFEAIREWLLGTRRARTD